MVFATVHSLQKQHLLLKNDDFASIYRERQTLAQKIASITFTHFFTNYHNKIALHYNIANSTCKPGEEKKPVQA